MPQIDGIVSGLDTTGLINATLEVYRAPQRALIRDEARQENQLEAVSGLSNRLSDLSSKLGELDTAEKFASFSTAVDNEDFISVEALGTATPGVYDVDVLALAENEVETTQGYASDVDNLLGTGTFSVTLAGEQHDITLDGTNNSLAGLADALDEIDGLSAYTVNTGEATNPFKLVVQADDTGLDNTITMDASGLTGGTAPVFTELRPAADAHVQINGMDVYSADNTLTNIPGMSLDLVTVSDSTTRVTVAADADATADKVQELVDAFNAAVDYHAKETVFDLEKKLEGGLVGDSTARRVIDGIQSVFTAEYATGTTFNALSQVGIATQQDGTLEFDREAFASAMEANEEDVIALFSGENGPAAALKTQIDDVYVDTDNGVLELKKDSLQESLDDLDVRISDYDRRLDEQAVSLRARFTAMEQALASAQSTGSYLAALFAGGGQG